MIIASAISVLSEKPFWRSTMATAVFIKMRSVFVKSVCSIIVLTLGFFLKLMPKCERQLQQFPTAFLTILIVHYLTAFPRGV